MDKQILNFTANEQILTVDEPIRISTNKVNYIEAHFELGQNWSGYDSVRAVWFNDFYCISTVLNSQGVCYVPSEVMKRNGKVKVNLVGSISENDVLTDRLTSYPVVAVIVDCTAMVNGAETAPITPSQFEQYVSIVHTEVETVAGIGVPVGGTTGQVLAKASDSDHDTEWVNQSGGGGGTSDYTDLTNKPKINNVELNGNKSTSDLGLFSGSYNDLTNKPALFSGNYNDLTNKPTIPTVPTNVSAFTNDAGYLTTETDPTVPSWAKAQSKPSYTASEVGAIALPSNPTTGAFLVWNGTAWVAQTLSTWQGGNY